MSVNSFGINWTETEIFTMQYCVHPDGGAFGVVTPFYI